MSLGINVGEEVGAHLGEAGGNLFLAAPTDFQITNVTDTTATVSFTPSAKGGASIYRIKDSSGILDTFNYGVSGGIVTGLTEDTPYEMWIVSSDGTNESAPSNTDSATTDVSSGVNPGSELVGTIWKMELIDSAKQPGFKELRYILGRPHPSGAECWWMGGRAYDPGAYYNPSATVATRKETLIHDDDLNHILVLHTSDLSYVGGSPAGLSDGMDYALLCRGTPGMNTDWWPSISLNWTPTQEIYIRLYQKWGDDEDSWYWPSSQQKFIGHLSGDDQNNLRVNFWIQRLSSTTGRLNVIGFENGVQVSGWYETHPDNESLNDQTFVFTNNTWYEIEVRAKAADTPTSNNGEYEFWINGEQRFLITGIDNYNGGNYYNYMYLQGTWNPGPTGYECTYMKNISYSDARIGVDR